MIESSRLLSEQESADLVHVSVETIRKYRECGLIDPVIRENRTFFHETDIRTIFYGRSVCNPDFAAREWRGSVVGSNEPSLDRSSPDRSSLDQSSLDESSLNRPAGSVGANGPSVAQVTADSTDAGEAAGQGKLAAESARGAHETVTLRQVVADGAASEVNPGYSTGTGAGRTSSDPLLDPAPSEVRVGPGDSFDTASLTAPAGEHTTHEQLSEKSAATLGAEESESAGSAANRQTVPQIIMADGLTLPASLPPPAELVEINKGLRRQVEMLREERNWLRERIEKLEARSEREQMLLLSESENLRSAMSLAGTSFWKRALPWLRKEA